MSWRRAVLHKLGGKEPVRPIRDIEPDYEDQGPMERCSSDQAMGDEDPLSPSRAPVQIVDAEGPLSTSRAPREVAEAAGPLRFQSRAVAAAGAAALAVTAVASIAAVVRDTDRKDTGRKDTGRKGSFLVLGDWGWDEATHGSIDNSTCQTAIAVAMLDKMQELGDVKFIINVGDSFYPAGVESRSDPRWDSQWRQRYAPELRSVPWYSTYGNHDYQHDPCACGDSPEDCAQFNNDVSDTNWFYFPDFSWYKEHVELGLEVVSLDLNQFMEGSDCQYSSCTDICVENIRNRTDEAIEFFKSRSQASVARNMLVFSHYPTDYLLPSDDLMSGLKSSQGATGAPRHIEYFGGHRHNVDQDSCASIAPNNQWLVGGGGGWGTDGDQQGFVVGEISDDFTINTYPVLVDMPCGEVDVQLK